jgi:hypothetical protein
MRAQAQPGSLALHDVDAADTALGYSQSISILQAGFPQAPDLVLTQLRSEEFHGLGKQRHLWQMERRVSSDPLVVSACNALHFVVDHCGNLNGHSPNVFGSVKAYLPCARFCCRSYLLLGQPR